jgi:phage shock protein C
MRRSTTNREIGGVCAGMAKELGFETFWIRILFVFLLFTPFPILLVYVLLWIFVPENY